MTYGDDERDEMLMDERRLNRKRAPKKCLSCTEANFTYGEPYCKEKAENCNDGAKFCHGPFMPYLPREREE